MVATLKQGLIGAANCKDRKKEETVVFLPPVFSLSAFFFMLKGEVFGGLGTQGGCCFGKDNALLGMPKQQPPLCAKKIVALGMPR